MKWNFLAPKFTKVLYSLKKLFLKFREIELSKPEIKTFHLQHQRQNCSMKRNSYAFSRKKPALKKFPICQEMELSSQKLKKTLYFYKKVILNF